MASPALKPPGTFGHCMRIITTGFFAPLSGVVLAVCFSIVIVPMASAESPTGRNILFISVDDLRNWAGYTNDYAGTVQTPNIDALAAVSTRYLNAYATVPHCVGSRTSVMMGSSPANHGITFASWLNDPQYLAVYNDLTLLSLPEVMRVSGYYTAVTGKVFHSPLPDRWNESGPTDRPASCFLCPGPDNTFIIPEVLPDAEEHPDQTAANWAVSFISSYAGSEPFFLATGFHLPHRPWRVPQWAYDLYPLEGIVAPEALANDLDDEPLLAVQLAEGPQYLGLTQYEAVEAAGKAPEYTQAYLASISHTDAMIGQIIAALEASPHAFNTDIVLWSDHGFHLGEKFHWGKLTFWDQSVRVPLLISSPGSTDYPVGDVTMPVSLLDMAPTVLDLAGLAPFPQFEGVPLRDGSSVSPVEIYWNDGRAKVVPGDKKTIDYDLGSAPLANDRAAYFLTDLNEETNLIVGC